MHDGLPPQGSRSGPRSGTRGSVTAASTTRRSGSGERCDRFVYSPPTESQVLSAAYLFLWGVEGGCPPNPYRPKTKDSGITLGVGWDAGYHSAEEFRRIWNRLSPSDLDRFVEAAFDAAGRGKTGNAAEVALKAVVDIQIPKDVALSVLRTTLKDYYAAASKTFPGLSALPRNTQVALISLVYNRGGALAVKDPHPWQEFDPRTEMREISESVRYGSLDMIAVWLRLMKRVWKGSSDEENMNSRREAEAKLVDADVKKYHIQSLSDRFFMEE